MSELSVPDARAKLEDARWKLSEALKDAAQLCPQAGSMIANIAQAHKHITDLIDGAPLKGSFANRDEARVALQALVQAAQRVLASQ